MRNKITVVLFLGLLSFGLMGQKVFAADETGMYRLYNPNSSEHFYTGNPAERNQLAKIGWKYEGGAWTAPNSGSPVYRLYNPNAGDHHYTTNGAEKNMLVKVGWKYEQIGWYSGGSTPVYRLYNPNAKAAGAHHYTLNKAEYNQLMRIGWKGEGVAWYALGNFDTSNEPPISTVPPRKVDQNITTAGGGEGNNPGSYRLLYSNKPFDSMPSVTQAPVIEFSTDIVLKGIREKNAFYGMQFIIAGNGTAGGQIGLDIGFQEGTSAEFAQNRISVKTVNFPAGAGNQGQQFYSVNTGISMDQTAKIAVKYYQTSSGEFVVTQLNGKTVGVYKTKLTTPNQYVLHAQVEDWKKRGASLQLRNLKVFKNGQDVTMNGAVNLHILNQSGTAGTAFDLVSNTDRWLIHGAY